MDAICRPSTPHTERGSCRLRARREESGDDVRRLLPVARRLRETLSPGSRERVVPRPAVVLRRAPLALDETFLLELQERRVQRSIVERQAISARLLDPARDAVPVERPHALDGLEHHQRQRALLDVELLVHERLVLVANTSIVAGLLERNRPRLRHASGNCRAGSSAEPMPDTDFPNDLQTLERDYELVREIGQGGMAAVYLGRH